MTSSILDKLPTVENSPKAPCWQQRQIAAQRSYIASVREDKEVVFGAPCDVDAKTAPKSAPKAEPKTS